MIKKLLLPLFLILVHTAVFAGTKTYNVTSGNWNTAANWMPSGVPTAADDVVIPSGKTVTVTAYAMAKSVSVSGSLSINNNIGLIVYGDFTVNSIKDAKKPKVIDKIGYSVLIDPSVSV